MNYGVIDIGSNTIRLNVYNEDRPNKEIFSKKSVAGLASYISDGELSPRGIKKLIKVLNSHKKILNYIPVDHTYLFATASLRNVSNHKEIIKNVKRETGYDIELIPDKEEARLGYLAAGKAYDFNKGITIDIGGGSTEIVAFCKGEIADVFNLSEGSLSLFSKYIDEILPGVDEYKALNKYLDSVIVPIKKLKLNGDTHAIGLGGTVRAIGNILQELHGRAVNDVYSLEDVLDLQRRIVVKDSNVLRIILQVVPERIHTVTTGSVILSTIMKKYKVNTIYVSNIGLREGYLMNKLTEVNYD